MAPSLERVSKRGWPPCNALSDRCLSAARGTGSPVQRRERYEMSNSIQGAHWKGQRGVVYPHPTVRPRSPAAVPPEGVGADSAFSFGGGRLLGDARVHLIFWGGAWTRWPTPSPSVGQCADAVLA